VFLDQKAGCKSGLFYYCFHGLFKGAQPRPSRFTLNRYNPDWDTGAVADFLAQVA